MTTKFVGIAMEGNKKIKVTVQEREIHVSEDGLETAEIWDNRKSYFLDPRDYQGMSELMYDGRRLIVEEVGDFLDFD